LWVASTLHVDEPVLFAVTIEAAGGVVVSKRARDRRHRCANGCEDRLNLIGCRCLRSVRHALAIATFRRASETGESGHLQRARHASAVGGVGLFLVAS
jgi:hypothetical protein